MKQYNLKGVASSVELGKQGPKLVGSANSVAIQDKDGNAEKMIMAQGTDADHAVTLAQLESETGFRVMTVNETVTYDGGSQYLFTAKANTTILGVMIEKTSGNWADYDSATSISVGDAAVNTRLFGVGWEPDGSQMHDNNLHKYTAETDIYAYVTQGNATSGGAKIRVKHTGPDLDQTGPQQIMNISDITEAKVVRTSDKKPKKIKPNTGHESPHPMQGKLVGEGNKPQKQKPYKPKQTNPVAKHSRNMAGAGAHKSPKDYDRKNKKADIKSQLDEGPLVLHGISGVNGMLDRFLDTWKSEDHSEEEYAELLKVLGKHIEFDGNRAVLTNLEEGNIGKAVGALALIAALGYAMPSAKDSPLGKELAQAAQQGDAVAEYHLDNLDLYMDASDQRTMINLKIAYIDDSPREDVKAYLAKKAGK